MAAEKGEMVLVLFLSDLVNLEGVSPALFITGVVFILLVGGFLSLGVVRLFQQHKRQGILYLALSALSLIGLIWSINTWFV
jgi:Na+-transporting NADH:ubiquinone oxidoreductase subunit NqrD